MSELTNLIIGIVVLILGIPIGSFLAKMTKDEQKLGQKWFKLIIIIAVLGAIINLIAGNDVLLFGFLFITVVTGMNLRKK